MAAATAAFRQQQGHQQQGEAGDEGVVVLRCFDGVKLAVPAFLARRRSALVAEAAGERVVDVPGHISGRVVARVVAYWEARASAATAEGFDGEFLGGLRHDARVDLIHAAYHLRDAALFDLFRFGA